ncbi:hypothetical protein MKZ38_002296 [Zalerion maritima]|uniref:Vacuolar protein sorting-associated protein n=1 Tax=Zalerion maritima TaxID=339359 RepID=A0AAD5WSJ9_9PEZI|nr:hypothetical protein MKZ38_002296 [Zalerion maritima]
MLEGLVAGLLNRFLGMYVKNFDPGQLRVGIWSGDVTLRDLELRREALDQLKLPINVAEGHLGELKLSIPWSNLRGAPVKVYIEDVFLLASPKEEAAYDEEDEDRRKQRLKMEKLDSAELLKERSLEGLSEAEQKRSQSFTQSLVTKIVDNLQVTVKNIHVRYEDSISAPNHPFALGVTLAEFSAVSTDGEWNPTFIQDSTKTTHKLATLGALSIYWNTDSELLGYGREIQSPDIEITPHQEMVRRFKEMIVDRDSAPAVSGHQFVLKPVSGQAKLEMDKSGDLHTPKMKATLLFDEIGLVLDDHQYRDALMMVDLFHYFIRHQEYKKHEPKGVTVKEDPRAWLRFAGDAVLSKIHERNRKWSWDYFRERRDDRIRYIELFKKQKQNQQFSPDETDDLSNLEWKLGYEDLRFWRSLARNQLKKENAAALKAQEEARANQPQQDQQGWLSWMWGSKPQEPVAKESENTQMTEQQRKELYEAIDWDEKTALAEAVEVPRDTVKMQVNASLRTGSFTLRQNPHNEDATDLLSLHFDMFKAKVQKRPDSFLSDISLGGLRVNDGTTPRSMFTEIVRVKDAPEVDDEHPISMDELEKSTENPFFNFVFEQNPLDGEGDFALIAKLKPLEIVWNPNFAVGIVNFFRPPERHMESINALMETAGATVEGLRQQTRAGLEFALEEHKTINAKLNLQAPLIIVPQSITAKRSTCIILDAGHISVNSQLVDRETMKEVQSKEKQQFTDQDLDRLRSLMYDKFLVKLTSTQLLIGPSIDETKAQLTKKDDEMRMRVVEKINVDFVVEMSILPKAPSLTRVRVSGRMPVLHAAVSDTKYKAVMRIIDVAIPKFDDGPQRPAMPDRKSSSKSRPRAKSNVSTRSQKTHRRSQSNQLFMAQQTAIIIDDNIDEGDNYEDAQDGTVNEQLKMQQRSFEFKFDVDELRGSLYKSDPDKREADRLLVELVAQHFDLEFYIRPYDMVAEVSLGSVAVDDFVDNPPAEFKSIVSSGDAEDHEEDRNLVQVKFVKVKKESPEFMTVYEGVETNINAAISTINLVVTRKTLLTLLDFILVTFTNNENNNPQQRPALMESESDSDVVDSPPPAPPQQQQNSGSIKVKVDLKSIRMILNNDGIRLATLSFMHADVGVFLRGPTMRIGVKLGDLSLVDDVNLGVSEQSNLRKLVTIQGDELADFRYETFDSCNKEAYPGYDSSIFLRAGSMKVNFVEEPFRKIVDFLVKFGKMQAIFNAARQAAANQANQLQQNSSRIKFDVVVKTPIVVFPRVVMPGRTERDLMTAYLGEIYFNNKFVPLSDSEGAQTGMKVAAGIRNIQLKSMFHYDHNDSEELELIDHVDLGFHVTYAEHQDGDVRPELEIEGTMSEVNLKITQYQLQFLLEISRSVPAVFAGDSAQSDEEAARDVDEGTLKRARTMTSMASSNEEQLVDLRPELGRREGNWTRLDLLFTVPEISLELVNAEAGKPVHNADMASLSRFSLDQSRLKTKMVADGSLEAEFVIHSFTIFDSRPGDANKYKHLMRPRNEKVQQFMASVSMSGGQKKSVMAIVAVDSPRVIFALDYVFAIQKFITAGLQPADTPDIDDDLPSASPDESDAESMQLTLASRASVSQKSSASRRTVEPEPTPQGDEPGMDIAFRVNVVDARVILIANPMASPSEAVELGTKQVLLSQQHALTFQVSDVGMSLCKVEKTKEGDLRVIDNSSLRIIDEFSILMSMDSSKANQTILHLDVEPLVLRLSLRDILLAMQIVTKATELSGSDKREPEKKPSASDAKARELRSSGMKQRTASGKGASTVAKSRVAATRAPTVAARGADGTQQSSTAVAPKRHEELTATIEGVRVVLIGDLHELPILDLNIKDFTLGAENWTSNLHADTSVNMYVNVYNFSKSSWEPLLEPWVVGLAVSRDSVSGQLGVEVASKRQFDVTVTTSTIALASKSFDFLTAEQDVLDKPRGVEAPYRIRNHTGFDVAIEAHHEDTGDINAQLEDGQEVPWSFEAWEKMREKLSTESQSNTVTVTLEGSGFHPVQNVRLNREGEFLYSLGGPKAADNVPHRILVDVTLGSDNVKHVVLRSPLLVENETQIPIELGVYDAREGHLLKIEKIPPGESRPAPVGAVYLKSLLVKPDSGFGYSWSTRALWWRDMLTKSVKTLMCQGEHGDPFYFQMSANFDRTNPLVKQYPYMRIKLSPPVVLENLLPFDFKYNIYDKNTKRDWSNFLRKGGVSPVHVTQLSHLLLLSIDMQDTVYKPSDFAIINKGDNEDFRKEHRLVCRDEEGLTLNLKLHYFKVPNSGGAFKVAVYSPYVILNKTGLDFALKARCFMKSAEPVAGQKGRLADVSEGNDDERPKAVPFMFSYGNDDHRNRSHIQVGDSEWSGRQTLDAIGSTSEVVLPSSSRNAEIHVGLSIESGRGKYKLSRVVTLVPRFIIQNKIGEEINVREPGSSSIMTLQPASLQPLHFLKQGGVKQLSLCYPGINHQWTSPFNISDVGTTHIKISRPGQRQKLVRVEVLMEEASIFLHLSMETKNWPFSMRNESDTEFTFHQANPNVDEDGVEDRSGWRPIKYRLPPRSIMPYAWDFPAAKFREVVISAHGKERHIKLAEIGNQVPMKFLLQGNQQKIIDINVAADGPTQTLILSNFKQSRSLYRQKSVAGRSTSSNSGFEVKKMDTGVTFKASLKLAGIGVSLINSQLRELAYVTFRGVELSYTETPLFQTVSLAVKWIQIDNQLYGGLFPMILYPSVVPKRESEVDAHPSVHFQVTRVKDDSYGVLYIKYATILLQEMTVELDEDFIYALLDFSKVPGASWTENEVDMLCDETLDIPQPTRDQSGQDIYFEVLNIQPMQLDLSFMRTERVNAEDKTSSRNPLMFFVNILTMAIGNVNDAPIRLNALLLENVRVTVPILTQNISNHYSQEVLYQVHKILGSADFLGNPVGLFNNISSGLTDVFYEPYQGLVMSDKPEDLGLGIAKGAASFVKKSVYGFSDSFSKFTGSLSKGLAAATLDKQYQDRRRITRARNRPKHALYGVTAGANSFFTSVASGVGGLARKPLEGAEQEGALGFFKGVGKGMLGFATKPAIGVLDMASNVSEGIRNTTTVFDGSELDRVRIPRFIPADGVVRPYNQREALGQMWLKGVDGGRYFDEQYIAHLQLPREDLVVMVTYGHILLVRSKRLTTEWDVPLKDVKKIARERTGLSLTLKENQNGPFIPIAEESSRSFLYRMVGVGVEEFNRRYRGE